MKPRYFTRKSAKTGFTLLELLVVVAIIGILAAGLIGGISKAKARARQTQCANNVRQVGLGMQAVVQENHTYPLVTGPSWIATIQNQGLSTSPGAPTHTWINKGVGECPSARKPEEMPSDILYTSYGYNVRGLSRSSDAVSLGLGGHQVWNGQGQRPDPPVKESEVVEPSRMIAIGDGFIGGDGAIKDGVASLTREGNVEGWYGDSTKRSKARHQGIANIAFCDAHVEPVKLTRLFDDTSDAALSLWNRDGLPHREMLDR